MIALVTRVQRKTTSRYKRQQLTKASLQFVTFQMEAKPCSFFRSVISESKADAARNNELVQLFAVACYPETLQAGQHLQTRRARDSLGEFTVLRAKWTVRPVPQADPFSKGGSR